MYLECFLPDPFNSDSWTYDVEPGTPYFMLNLQGEIVLKIPEHKYDRITVMAISVLDRLENLAEEMLHRAASLKPGLSEKRLIDFFGNYYGVGEIFAILPLRSRKIAVSYPEYLGRAPLKVAANTGKSLGLGNLVLFNPTAVFHILEPKLPS